MSLPIVGIEHLSKRYVIAHKPNAEDGLRHAIERALRNPLHGLRTVRQRRAASREAFWALRDINLEIQPGEVVGIIGRNGAGKSTLLKVLSRITEPTEGRVRLRGLTSSLLEVGAGFHSDLTGCENIYLNGAILGMRRAEIARKFDEIVSFAEIGPFLDTPVKHYSSGMYVRLAFAVAAHLDPDILIVDEVLAVGDASFQKKCLDKMDGAGRAGRTLLFVSHNMQAVTRLCRRCILLEEGCVRLDGDPDQVVSSYLGANAGTKGAREWTNPCDAPGDDVVRLRAVRARLEDGIVDANVDIRSAIGIEIEYDVLKPGYVFHPHFGVYNEAGLALFIAQDVDPVWRKRRRPTGRYVSTGWIPGNLLAEGLISISVSLMTLGPEHIHVWVGDAVLFRVVDPLSADDTSRGDYPRPIPGVLRPLLTWTTSYTPSAEPRSFRSSEGLDAQSRVL